MKDAVTLLYNWLAISDEPQKADLLFLFGAPTLAVPEKGLALFKAGFAPSIVVTGERSLTEVSEWDKTLADKYAEYLIENGVAGSHIIIQNRSLNTLQDVTFSLAALTGVERIILVNRPMQQRRGYATFQKQTTDLILINTPCMETMPEDQFAARCVLEYEKIKRYADKGDIEQQIVPDEIREAYQKLKAILG
ncbi:MAG: YdcF family protein [Ktedonobacteraceae bacterium]